MDESLKKRRALAYKLNKWDDQNLPYKVHTVGVVEEAIKFFNSKSDLIYPAKSYFVAIVYAACMEKYFQKPFYEALDDAELLPDDPFFIQYSKAKIRYNIIINNIVNINSVSINNNELSIDDINYILNYPSTQKTIDYFKKEFLLDKKVLVYK